MNDELFSYQGVSLDEIIVAMKSFFKLSSLGINPIYRDLVLVVLAGLLASTAIVTMGYMVASQF